MAAGKIEMLIKRAEALKKADTRIKRVNWKYFDNTGTLSIDIVASCLTDLYTDGKRQTAALIGMADDILLYPEEPFGVILRLFFNIPPEK